MNKYIIPTIVGVVVENEREKEVFSNEREVVLKYPQLSHQDLDNEYIISTTSGVREGMENQHTHTDTTKRRKVETLFVFGAK